MHRGLDLCIDFVVGFIAHFVSWELGRRIGVVFWLTRLGGLFSFWVLPVKRSSDGVSMMFGSPVTYFALPPTSL